MCDLVYRVYLQHICTYLRIEKLQELLEGDYVNFESLNNIEMSYMLGGELWENMFDGLNMLQMCSEPTE